MTVSLLVGATKCHTSPTTMAARPVPPTANPTLVMVIAFLAVVSAGSPGGTAHAWSATPQLEGTL